MKSSKISRFSYKYHKRGMPNDPFVLFGMWEKGRNFAIVKKKQNKNINNMLLRGVARPNIHKLFKNKRSHAGQEQTTAEAHKKKGKRL